MGIKFWGFCKFKVHVNGPLITFLTFMSSDRLKHKINNNWYWNNECLLFVIFIHSIKEGRSCPEEAHLFIHHVPVPLFDARVTESIDQRHVNLERLQPRFDFNGCRLRSSEVWVSKLFGQLVCCLPQVLYLIYFRFHKWICTHIIQMHA